MPKTSTKTRSRSEPCIEGQSHRWSVGSPDTSTGGLLGASCTVCGRERTFPAFIDPTFSDRSVK